MIHPIELRGVAASVFEEGEEFLIEQASTSVTGENRVIHIVPKPDLRLPIPPAKAAAKARYNVQ